MLLTSFLFSCISILRRPIFAPAACIICSQLRNRTQYRRVCSRRSLSHPGVRPLPRDSLVPVSLLSWTFVPARVLSHFCFAHMELTFHVCILSCSLHFSLKFCVRRSGASLHCVRPGQVPWCDVFLHMRVSCAPLWRCSGSETCAR